ncbi:Effector protein PevD1 [Colletotrichum trifolii]|uniref:Effector protein PevD1 n=1 Tax=Colletotrichum trifolii TaxID=5466 RepID=A0A4R8QTU5_COLTR|nr:Effector protein PevD1 [Colletotrichum trifolii]
MQLTSAFVLALLGPTVLAAPTSPVSALDPEAVVINEFTARHETSGLVSSVGLRITALDAENLDCTKTDGVTLETKYNCGESKYSFALVKGTAETWGLRIYHRWGVASGASGSGDVPAYCHAGPLGSTVCTSQNPLTWYIDAAPKDW